MASRLALGLMSGTSMDGIDVAAVRTDGDRLVERGPALAIPYEASFRRRIEQGLAEAKSLRSRIERIGGLADLERDLTLRHAEAVRRYREIYPKWSDVEVIGFHGQTVLHRPGEGLTVQLGDGLLLASQAGIPVVYDMRAADMEAGGQGAPLVPAYHVALAHSLAAEHRGFPIAIVNIGGISNVTFVPEQGDPVAFDSGPGNQLIDQWMQREGGMPFDQDGAVASEGRVHADVVAHYLKEPFFARKAPKSLDRGDFTLGHADGLELADGARTLASLAGAAVFKSAELMPARPKLWIICGGGRKNPHIIADLRIAAEAEGGSVVLAEEAGLDGDATEAEAWAYLAVRSQRGLPLTFPTTTGCREPTRGGVLAQPK